MSRWVGPIGLLACAIVGGFVWGRTVGIAARRHHVRTLADLTHLLARADRRALYADATLDQVPDSTVPPSQIYDAVLDHVEREFVLGLPNAGKLSSSSLSRMIASLGDPGSYYIEPSQRAEVERELRGRFDGIGAVLTVRNRRMNGVDYSQVTVVDPVVGGPAQKAGLRPGDVITGIDGKWVIAYSPRVEIDKLLARNLDDQKLAAEFDKVVAKFKQGVTISKALPELREGTSQPVSLTIQRAGASDPVTLKVDRATSTEQGLTVSRSPSGVVWLRIREFNGKSQAALQSAVGELRGARSLVVDLRGCSGGVHAAATTGLDGLAMAGDVVGQFARMPATMTLARRPGAPTPFRAGVSAHGAQPAVVVLVDGGTANLGELVAGQLRASAGAKLVGATTFGDDTVATYARLTNGGAVRVTTQHIGDAAGHFISTGIKPDVAAAVATDADADRAVDTVLHKH